MREQRRRYGCAQPLLLGAIYDVLEDLKWTLVSANSDDGILYIREPSAGIPFVIRLSPQGNRVVELSAVLASGAFSGRSLPEESITRFLGMLEAILAAVAVQPVPFDELKEE
jgi:hypothetical protein